MNRFLSDWTNWQLVVATAFVALCALTGWAVDSDYLLQVMVLAAVFAAMGTAWSIAGGLSGLLLLGYISFFGVGAYLDGLLFTKMGVNPWLCIVLSFFAAAARWPLRQLLLAGTGARPVPGAGRQSAFRWRSWQY